MENTLVKIVIKSSSAYWNLIGMYRKGNFLVEWTRFVLVIIIANVRRFADFVASEWEEIRTDINDLSSITLLTIK